MISRAEAREFSYAQRFLWSVRCHLHLRAGREDDRLTFDAQMDIAPLLGFANRQGLSGVRDSCGATIWRPRRWVI